MTPISPIGPGDVDDACLRYHVEKGGGGVPTLLITGSCAEFHRPDLLDRLDCRIYVAAGESVGLAKEDARLYREVQDYSLLAQEFSQRMLFLYINEALNRLFGSKQYWYMFEFAKSRGALHFQLFAICAAIQPHKLPREMGCGELQEDADAIDNWACGAPSFAAMRHEDTPAGGMELPNVSAPDGVWAPEKTATQKRYYSGGGSFRPHPIACAKSYCFHRRIDYCKREPMKGGKKDHSPGAVLRECRMGYALEATPRQAGAPWRGDRPPPGI